MLSFCAESSSMMRLNVCLSCSGSSLLSLRVIVDSETPMTFAICQKKTPFSFAYALKSLLNIKITSNFFKLCIDFNQHHHYTINISNKTDNFFSKWFVNALTNHHLYGIMIMTTVYVNIITHTFVAVNTIVKKVYMISQI